MLKATILILVLLLKNEIILNQTQGNFLTKNRNAHINWDCREGVRSTGYTTNINDSKVYFISVDKNLFGLCKSNKINF